jgi:hypothetical protein
MPSDNVLPNLNGYSLIKTEEQPWALSKCIFDTAASVGLDANTSHISTFACMFQVNTVPTGTVVSVQAKIAPDAEWLEIWQSTDADPHFIQTYQMPYNFQRAVRLSGTGAVKAFSAAIPTDSMG